MELIRNKEEVHVDDMPLSHRVYYRNVVDSVGESILKQIFISAK